MSCLKVKTFEMLAQDIAISEDALSFLFQSSLNEHEDVMESTSSDYADKVVRTLERMLSTSAYKLPDWFKRLSNDRKLAYVKKHATGKIAKAFAPTPTKKTAKKAVKVKAKTSKGVKPKGDNELTKVGGNRIVEKITPKGDDDELPPEDEDKLKDLKIEKFVPEKKSAIAAALKKAFNSSKDKVVSMFSKEKNASKDLESLMNGEELDEKRETRAKSLAMRAGKHLVMSAVFSALLFTPLADVAGAVGLAYLDHLQNGDKVSESSDEEQKDKKEFAEVFMNGMVDWLSGQDPEELASKLSEEYPGVY